MITTVIDFNPRRLTLARRRRGLTKVGLAKLLKVDTRSITAYESGEFRPDNERLDALSEKLHFPVQFFFGDDLDEIEPDVVSFRSMSKMTAGQRDSALGAGSIALLLDKWIADRFELPHAEIPDLSQEGHPEAAAVALRQMWGLGELPIKNVVHLLESRGVRVFSLAIDALEVDAFSMWHRQTPFVFLNTQKSCEHSRFDAAHELGHLVLHRHAGAKGQEAEREANNFASAFLMPRASVLANAPYMATVAKLIQLKPLWIISVAALAYRLHEVGLVSDWHYRNLCIEIAKRGYRRQEPNEAPRENSQVLAKVFAALREEKISKLDVARDLNVEVEELEQLIFGLTITGLKGGGKAKNYKESAQPELRLVSSKDK